MYKLFKKRPKPFTFTSTIIVLTLFVCSQFSFAGHFQGSVDFSLGFPQGELDANIDNTVLGVGVTFGVNLGKSPFMLGVDLGVLNYGNDKHLDYLYGDPDFAFRVKHSYNILQGLAFLRIQPFKHGTVSPYIDGLLGVNYLWTETSIGDDHGYDEEEVVIETNYEDTALAYGIGGGLMIRLGKTNKKRTAHRKKNVFIDLRFRYLFGGNAEYLTRGSILADEEGVVYLVSESRSDLFTFQVGVGFGF
ncbi:MAG: outer membrane beta-barrel protein [bacterium]|nr:outer membrane beta-barrel protein [bacterium]